jgi:hypothetical protein
MPNPWIGKGAEVVRVRTTRATDGVAKGFKLQGEGELCFSWFFLQAPT